MQVNISRFSYLFVWLSLLFRPVVIGLLWKDSRDFRRIIRGKSGSNDNEAGPSTVADNQELELARIMSNYGGGSI